VCGCIVVLYTAYKVDDNKSQFNVNIQLLKTLLAVQITSTVMKLQPYLMAR